MREQIKNRLVGALRQFRHNTDNSGSLVNPEQGFVTAYDKREVDTLVSDMEANLPFNELTPAQAERLHYLIEECGEVIHAAGKILRHGYESYHPDGGQSNREHLTEELGHLFVATRMMWLRGDYDWRALCYAQDAKYLRINKYLHHDEFTYQELRRGS